MKVYKIRLLKELRLSKDVVLSACSIVDCNIEQKTIFHHSGWYRFSDLPDFEIVKVPVNLMF